MDAAHEREQEQAQRRKGVYAHVLVFAIAGGALFIVNLVASRHTWWSAWPVAAWAMILAAHAFGVLIVRRRGPTWKDTKTLELIEHYYQRHPDRDAHDPAARDGSLRRSA
jgi:hypothetical protein